MADKKISALTAATTPLAGTEVLPIVQGGSTVKVSAANLTAGRNISTTGITVSSNTGNIELNWAAGSTHKVGSTFSTSYFTGMRVDADTRNTDIISLDASGIGNVRIRTGPTETTQLNVDPTGNVTVSTGNLVIGTAAKGIDFSANTHAAGMTSELLNDYEEGTLTAAVSCGTSGTISLYSVYDTLTYTRIGRQVTVVGQIKVESVSSPVGHFTVSLPYAIGNFGDTAGSISAGVTMQNVVSANVSDFVAIGDEADAFIKVYLGDGTNLQSDSAQQVQTNTDIFLNITYFV